MTAINGNAAIFRCTNTGDNESNVTSGNLIQFDAATGQTCVPDNNSHVSAWDEDLVAAINENPRPQSNNPHDLQDNGLAQVILTITLFFEDPTNAAAPAFLRNWMREAKMTAGSTSAFPFGRFGVRHNDFTIFNHTPTTTSGYVLVECKAFRPTDIRYKVGMTLILKYNGDITKLGT